MLESTLPFPLKLSLSDLAPRPLEELAKEVRVSRSFLRLCASIGCPLEGDRALAPGPLLEWLAENFSDVRRIAGLRPLAAVGALAPIVVARLKMLDAISTMLEYGRTRATDWRQKRLLRQALEVLSRLGDRPV